MSLCLRKICQKEMEEQEFKEAFPEAQRTLISSHKSQRANYLLLMCIAICPKINEDIFHCKYQTQVGMGLSRFEPVGTGLNQLEKV